MIFFRVYFRESRATLTKTKRQNFGRAIYDLNSFVEYNMNNEKMDAIIKIL